MVVKRTILCLILTVLLFGAMQAQNVRVSSSVSKSVIPLSDQLQLSLDIKSDSQLRIAAPSAPGVSGLIYRNVVNSSSSQTSIINGRVSNSYSLTFIYNYTPQKTGKFTIPGFKFSIGKTVYSTRPISIEVVDAPASPPSQYNMTPYYDPYGADYYSRTRNNGESLLLCQPESQTVYSGEPAVVSYYLYTNQMVESFSSNSEKDYEGYGKSVFEQPNSLNYENVTFKGERFQRALIKRTAIYPQVTGRLQAPTLTGMVQFSGVYSFMNRNIVSSPAWMDVKPLPAGKPAAFTGAVGNFTVSQSFSQTKVTLGEALICTIKISGKGNFSQFTAPAYPASSKFQISEPTVQDKLSNAIEGTRFIYFTILPQETGEHQIPGYQFSWFDSSSGSYRSFQGAPRTLTVKPANVLSYFSGLLQGDKPKTLNPLITAASYPAFRNFSASLWFWLIVAAYIVSLLVSGFIAYEKRSFQLDPVKHQQKTASRILNRYLRKATDAAQEMSPEFHPLAESGLLDYLAKKYGVSKSLSTSELLAVLAEMHIPTNLINQLEEFLTICQKARYMPGGMDASTLADDLVKLKLLVQALSRYKPAIVSATQTEAEHLPEEETEQ